MPYLPESLPAPAIDETSAPFWERCNAKRLSFQQCADCLTLVHPPLPVCPKCQSVHRNWVDAPSRARVFSFVWAHTAAHDSVKAVLPYNVVLVEFPDLPGVRLLSNVIGTMRGELAIGDGLELVWDQQAENRWLPRFRRVGAPAAQSGPSAARQVDSTSVRRSP